GRRSRRRERESRSQRLGSPLPCPLAHPMPEAKLQKRSPSVKQASSIGWLGAMLSGLALVTIALMLVVLFGVVDALHFGSIADFFTPDPAAAAGTLGLVGGAEGVTLSIVLLGVMFGIQTTSSRYSPRIIGIFTRNPLNALVLSFALASILYTFLVRSEVKVNYVPMASVAVAEVLALINFALLFPYVLYTFEVMRAETLVSGIMRRARRELRGGMHTRRSLQHRSALLTCLEQVSDIAFGSVQLGCTRSRSRRERSVWLRSTWVTPRWPSSACASSTLTCGRRSTAPRRFSPRGS